MFLIRRIPKFILTDLQEFRFYCFVPSIPIPQGTMVSVNNTENGFFAQGEIDPSGYYSFVVEGELGDILEAYYRTHFEEV